MSDEKAAQARVRGGFFLFESSPAWFFYRPSSRATGVKGFAVSYSRNDQSLPSGCFVTVNATPRKRRRCVEIKGKLGISPKTCQIMDRQKKI